MSLSCLYSQKKKRHCLRVHPHKIDMDMDIDMDMGEIA